MAINFEFTPEFQAYAHTEKHEGDSIITVKSLSFEENQSEESRAPVNIVAVLDKSGSMYGRKIELVRQTLKFIIDECKRCMH